MSLQADRLLIGRVAVVAGGGGALGSAIASRLHDEGARVYCLERPGRPVPSETTLVECDLTQSDQVTAALEQVDRESSRLDILVHAAGVTRDGRVWKLTDDDWTTVLRTNLDSAFFLIRAATPIFRRTGGGSIVLISSINGERAKVGLANYSASKAGLNALGRTAARELGGFEVRVNVVAPGWIETPMTADYPEAVKQRARDEAALGRMGVPDDVARAVLFLASDLARHVTGQVLRVDGGQLIG